MVIWKHLFQRILQHQNRKRKYSWEAADRLPCPYIPPQTSALITPSGIPDQLSFGLTQLGCFHILKSILFILLFLNCSAVLLRAIVKHSYVPLQAWTWSQKGFCLFVWSCKIYPRIYLIIHTHTVVKKNKPSKKKTLQDWGNSWHSPKTKHMVVTSVLGQCFLQPIHLMEVSTQCQILSRCPCKYFPCDSI